MKTYLLIGSAVILVVAFGYLTIDPKPERITTLKAPPVKSSTITVQPPPALLSHMKSIEPPPSYKKTDVPGNIFGQWLQQLPLRRENTVYLYDGSKKNDQASHFAVLNVPYNRHPLQQCADAVMRLRAEFIFETGAEENIRFFHQHHTWFTCPSKCTRPQLETFLNNVFNWCGSYNLASQLQPVSSMQDVQAGDVFVKGGSPGHAMLVAATAKNSAGEKVFLLLQSFMPAQDIHIVINPYNQKLSPWYSTSSEVIVTPGWIFTKADLRRW